jgi:hypothetical protein
VTDLCAIAGQALDPREARAIAAASVGDLEAQRGLRNMYMAHLFGRPLDRMNDDVVAFTALSQARTVAARGDLADLSCLAGVLVIVSNVMTLRARLDLADRATAEAIALLDRMAGAGHEIAGHAINELAKNSSPVVLEMAKQFAQPAIGKESSE